jgi:hypothetical protein
VKNTINDIIHDDFLAHDEGDCSPTDRLLCYATNTTLDGVPGAVFRQTKKDA